ncbi:MAG: TadE/TadG family type IV pilus assembly protein [Bryobacteraceae bacterium]
MRQQVRRRKGNAMLDVGLIAIPLLGLLFGIFDFGYAIFLRSCLQNSVREGVRYAVTYQTTNGTTCQDASITNVVKKSALGFLTPSDKAATIHVRYYDPTTFSEIMAPAGNTPGNIVEVSVENYMYSWMVPLYWSSSPLNITVRSSDRMEGLPGGGQPPCRVPANT